MFRVYLDGNLQDVECVVNVNEVAQFTIIREDGFNSTEQILREKSDMEISFCGASYRYICQQITSNRCAEIAFRIEDLDCGLFFDGVIPVVLAEFDLTKCIVKCKVKDNSFSAYIRDFLNVEITINDTKSVGCETIKRTDRYITMKKTHDNDVDVIEVMAFDALDVFQYLVDYFTNGTIDVVSNFLATNKYAFTTGFNMHNYGAAINEIYPQLSIQTLFDELRKKLHIYMGVEYDTFGAPYLRIEEESYFFGSTLLMEFDNIPNGSIQTYDIDRNFNAVKVGSVDSEVDAPAYNYIVRNKYEGWQEGIFTGCGTCSGNRESELDLVSDWIISSNLIYEALNAGNADYVNDDSIFLFEYESGNTSKRELVSGEYIYNLSLINSEVLQNWIDYYGDCIALKRFPSNGFLVQDPNYSMTVSGGFGFEGQNDMVEYTDTIYDESGSIFTYTGNAQQPPNLLNPLVTIGSVVATYFEVPANGDYVFKAQVIRFLQSTKTDFPNDTDLQVQIIIYSDNTFATFTDYYENTENTPNAATTPVTNIIETPQLTLTTGNCVMVRVTFKDNTGNIPIVGGNFTYTSDMVTFEMLSDGTCESLEYNDQNSKPFVVEFGYPLCFQEWQLMRENKNGFVRLKGEPYWIKEITYRHKQLSTLKLIGNNPLCGC